MKILLPLALIVAVLLVYALWGRDWLKRQAFAQSFFDWIEPIEIALFRKSTTILFARLKVVTGLMLLYATQASQIDWTLLMPFIPEQYRFYINIAISSLPALISLIGWADENLRKKTTLPIEIVSVPEKVIAGNSDVAVAVAEAKSTNVVAVAAIDEAKTEAKAA